nr:sulfite exporter TauE/SafE family protein [Desulfobulbaceae bacterium]
MSVYNNITGFFVLGLLGGFGHCVGMCNPFVLYIASRFSCKEKSGKLQLLLPHITYNSGRITTYISLGLFCGILGKISGDLIRIQGFAAIAAGIFLVLYGLFGLVGKNLLKKAESITLVTAIINSIRKVEPSSPFLLGITLGFMPCGLVYSALVSAVALGSPLAGGSAMAAFGLGTSVAMLTAALFGNYIISKRGIFNKLSMLLLIGMGIYFIVAAL